MKQTSRRKPATSEFDPGRGGEIARTPITASNRAWMDLARLRFEPIFAVSRVWRTQCGAQTSSRVERAVNGITAGTTIHTPQAWIADEENGLIPTMFITRVRVVEAAPIGARISVRPPPSASVLHFQKVRSPPISHIFKRTDRDGARPSPASEVRIAITGFLVPGAACTASTT